jgi:RNA polymerase sigma factor (sigma-70 family)
LLFVSQELCRRLAADSFIQEVVLSGSNRGSSSSDFMQAGSWRELSHEDIFAAKYDLLRRWALSLVRHDSADADDLVQTAFFCFVRRRPHLDAIANLDAYLFTLLRHLRLSQMRTTARRQWQSLDALDRASMAHLHQADAMATSSEAKDHLVIICQYACARKQVSKAGSILLLRFFQGYYPSEIALIARLPYSAIRVWVATARREARLFLLGGAPHGSAPPKPVAGAMESLVDTVSVLRMQIFLTRKGHCLSSLQWRRLYQDSRSSLTSERLAHLSSCPSCLELVTQYLGLGPYEGRYPTDTLGPERCDVGRDGRDICDSARTSKRTKREAGSPHGTIMPSPLTSLAWERR